MDNKIKYVDLNGLKVFAEALKQDLKNHVIELGLYQELLHRIENLELYKIVDSLPKIGDENTIYLLKNPSGSGDKNVFIEYLYNNEHGWEEIGNFTPSFDLEDYVRVEDAPFEKGETENSAILKGGNNQVISEGGVALGKDNFVGLKGWYYKAVQIGNDSNVVYLYLTTEQQIPILVSTANAVENQEKDININISKGDICSIINGNRLIDCFEFRLNEISNYGRISFTYKGKGTNPLITIQNVEELKLEDYSVFCISKPSCGIVDLSKCNISLGNNTKSLAESSVSIGLRSTAVGITSYAEGQDTIAVGECAHAEGKQTIAEGEHSHSEGYWTKAHGKSSHVEGQGLNNTTYSVASGDYSHSEGFYTRAFGTGSHTEGTYTIAYNKGEHAEGIYNKSIENVTLHSVGIGTSNTNRKNAHEITTNGKHYILGIGNYDGTKLYGATDVATVINNKADKSDIVTPDWNAQKGEAGYIKNKPFYNNVDYVINKGGEYNNVYEKSSVIFNNKTLFNLEDIAYDDVIVINSGPPVTLEKRYESDGTVTLIIEDISNYLSVHPILIGDLVTISEVLIPDTIARKSDIIVDPNVVDPVVWKYLCNPCVIKNGEQVPEDLLGSQDTFKYTDRGMYIVYDEGSGSSYTIEEVTSTEINLCMGGYVEIVNGCWETNF